MNPAEVVVSEVERERGFQVLPLLAETDCKTGKPSPGRANGRANVN